MIMLVLCVYVLPAIIGSVPGLVALGNGRRVLGWGIVAGAVVTTIPLAIFLDRSRTRAMTEAGLVADDWAVSLVLPFFLGVIYLVAAAIVYVVVALVTKRRDHAGAAKKSHG